ncbi:class I SAM-dependent methyltransferase [Agrobacterium rosae]|uniref:Class I SAM-dependent methyltransferase n=1 Tax=Agrobacterium rosae TaxID=1972867 RepID=A0AAW9FSS2_9HYPH|nr:class I SAM-dependent methyltransferase [Agrobacterium rosae]MDX8305838.1 class I SAM-dependent methyltransferase [Agrobacterium rosae]
MREDEKTSSYWEIYYKKEKVTNSRSSFAHFVLINCRNFKNLVDIGCGNGRDSFFFASHELNVIGIDNCVTAIEFCEKRTSREKIGNCTFLRSPIADVDVGEVLDQRGLNAADSVIYARFFLHAVDEESEDIFMRSAAKLVEKGALLCLEFRTIEDSLRFKFEPSHYRRYIDPRAIAQKATDLGMQTRFFEEGENLAAHKTENPYVARFIFDRGA